MVAEATARQRAQQRARAIRTAQRLEKRLFDVGTDTLAEMRGDLEDARTRIIARLADTSAEWERQRLDALFTEVERQMRVWEKKSQERMGTALGAAHEQGVEMPVAVLDSAGVTVAARPTIGTAYVAAAYQAGVELVTDVTDDTITAIRSTLRRGALAQLTPLDAIKELGPVVGKGRFATAFHRAEAIVRTEMGRVAQTSSYASLSELAKRDTGLMKEWVATLDRRVRPDHLAAHSQRRKVDEPFTVGGEDLMYPLDPRGSARNTVSCRCVSVPWRPDWEEDAVPAVPPPPAPSVEDLLRTGDFIGAQPLGGGVNATWRAEVGGVPVAIKPAAGLAQRMLRDSIPPGTDLERELAAYLVNLELGGLVDCPVVALRDDTPWGRAAVIEWKDRAAKGSSGADVALFDAIIGNTDRHSGNYLKTADDKRYIPIDHGLSFPESKAMGMGNYQILYAHQGEPLTDRQRSRLEDFALRETEIRERLRDIIPEDALDWMFGRAGDILTIDAIPSPQEIGGEM